MAEYVSSKDKEESDAATIAEWRPYLSGIHMSKANAEAFAIALAQAGYCCATFNEELRSYGPDQWKQLCNDTMPAFSHQLR